ncbi:MAG: 2-oxoisovalerate dehydrogenase [Myxococcota bacterium]
MDDESFVFIVHERPEGGFVAQSMGACIMTEGDDLETLRHEICDAVCCHFDDGCKPRRVKLRFVQVVREETLEP